MCVCVRIKIATRLQHIKSVASRDISNVTMMSPEIANGAQKHPYVNVWNVTKQDTVLP